MPELGAGLERTFIYGWWRSMAIGLERSGAISQPASGRLRIQISERK
jgi:hypothetical protein